MEPPMECTACGAELEADSKFCSRCAAPVPGAAARASAEGDEDELDDDETDDDEAEDDEPEDDLDDRDQAADDLAAHAELHEPAPPASGPGAAAKISGVIAALAMIVLGIVKLTDRPTVRFEVIEAPDPGYGLGATPTALPRDTAPERAPSDDERVAAGTWVATGVGFDAPRPVAMGSTLVQMRALREGIAEPMQRCIWLELYDNLRGFQHECGVVDGEPSVLQRTDPGTGRSSPLGVAFRWAYEGLRLSLTYDEEMVVTAGGRTTRFTRTVLTLPQGSSPFDVQQSFPEHPDVPPIGLRFEVFPGRYLGDPPQSE